VKYHRSEKEVVCFDVSIGEEGWKSLH
jgi:hypothetical protein